MFEGSAHLCFKMVIQPIEEFDKANVHAQKGSFKKSKRWHKLQWTLFILDATNGCTSVPQMVGEPFENNEYNQAVISTSRLFFLLIFNS